ncbi:hypothetical protein ACRTDM_05205 [Shewanella algae]|uniref:hypothetical protein n=1 Tax=Shewanella algae TaxID=38313 RepID=UPI003D7E3B0F
MMKKVALIAAMALAMAGCATSPVLPSKAKLAPTQNLLKFQKKDPINNSQITVVRDEGFVGSACSLAIFLDGKKSATLNPGEKAVFYVSTDVNTIGVGLNDAGMCSGASIKTIHVSPSPEKPRIFRVGGDTQGFHISPFMINEGEL